MKLSIQCLEFRAVRKNTLCGFATLRIVEISLVVRDIAVHQQNDKRWIGWPARPMVENGALLHDDNGKVKYSKPLIDFDRPDVRIAFSARAVDAIAAFDATAFPEVAYG